MIIAAKFASLCPVCSQRIEIGAKVEWSKGAKAAHVACGASGVATRAEPVSLDGTTAIRSQRGHGPSVRLCAGGCGRRVGPRYAECYSCHRDSMDAM